MLMTDLKSLCEHLGWKNVESYIQSGNLVFDSHHQNHELEKKLERAITDKFGYDVPVIVRTAKELENSISNNPFFDAGVPIEKLHLTFLLETPSVEQVKWTQSYNHESDKFIIVDKDVFILCEGKYHKSKLTNNFFEKKLKTGATTRNWKTVLKLYDLTQN